MNVQGNISGFKRLNGSQVLKENISYILNSLKLTITENEKQKTILHIFNSKSILDGTILKTYQLVIWKFLLSRTFISFDKQKRFEQYRKVFMK